MGQASSRTIIDYDAAVVRLGSSEVSRIESGFARLGVQGRLSRQEFRTGFLCSVLGTDVPQDFAAALFNGFDASASGTVTVREFVCALAVLRCGTPEEKLRLAFAVYDADRDERLSDQDVARFSRALANGATQEQAVEQALQSLAAVGPSISFKRFAAWAHEHIDSPLVAWVYNIEQVLAAEMGPAEPHAEDPPSQRKVRMLPTQRSASAVERSDHEELAALCQEAGVDKATVGELRIAWKEASTQSRLGVVDAIAFAKVLPSLPASLSERLFHALDQTKTGTTSLKEWCRGLGVCLAGSPEARRKLCFRLFAEGRAEEPAAVSPPAAEELRHLAELGITVFAEGPDGPGGGPTPREPPPAEGLSCQHLDAEPWASEADALVCAIGHALRIDLRLRPPELREEREIVDRLSAKFSARRPGRRGYTWYLISKKWMDMWHDCTNKTATQEMPSIDNSALVNNGSLRIGLAHHVDYRVITEGAWRALQAWYGGSGPELPRKVVELDGRCELEMYPLRLHVCRTDRKGRELLLQRALEVSRAALLGEVKRMACGLHGISDPVQVLHRSSRYEDWSPGDESLTLHALEFTDGHLLLLQLQGSAQPQVINNPHYTSGVVGLQNLGNTCYMNASLQCLLSAPILPSYFQQDYLYDLNMEGAWGCGGKLAVAFADVLSHMANAESKGLLVVSPESFRRVLGDLRNQFAGWQQQDAQEFLSILLEDLNEDVNRAQTKPYIVLKDSNGRPDAEVACEYWSAHCRRECSVVTALFSGQFKSVLQCKACGHANAGFEAFTFLSVPLPEQEDRWMTCFLVRAARSGVDQHTVRLCLRVPKRGTLDALFTAVADKTGLKAIELVAVDVSRGYVFRRLSSRRPLIQVSDDFRLVIYHVPPMRLQPVGDEGYPALISETPSAAEESERRVPQQATGFASRRRHVVVYFVHRRMRRVTRYFLNPYRPELFGMPLVIRVPSPCRPEELYQAAWDRARYLLPDLEELPAGHWPFVLSTVKRDGSACAGCSWHQGCIGCTLVAGDHSVLELTPEQTFSIDWDAEVLQNHFKAKIAVRVDDHSSVEQARQERKAPVQLGQCLNAAVKAENVPAHCSKCAQRAGENYSESPHEKVQQIWAGPPLLVVQLKRFRSTRGLSYKLLQHVTFPTSLDARDFMASDTEGKKSEIKEVLSSAGSSFRSLSRTETRYRLFAVVNHIGEMCSGHYTAYVKRGSAWFCCNDDHTYSISEQEVVSSVDAYLLFYSRVDVTAGEVGLRDLFPAPPPHATVADIKEVRRRYLRRASSDRERSREGSLFDWFSTRAPAVETVLSRLAQHPPGDLPPDASDIFAKLQKGFLAIKNDKEAVAKLEPKDTLLHFLVALYKQGSLQSPQIRNMVIDLSEVEAWRSAMENDEEVRTKMQESFPAGALAVGRSGGSLSSDACCSSVEDSSETLVGANGLVCSWGHPIVKQKRCARWHQHWLREISCNYCKVHIPRSEARWRCQHRCDYNVCASCYARVPSETKAAPVAQEVATSPE